MAVATRTTSDPLSSSLTIALLDLPVGSLLTVDGHVRVLQRDDFVGIRGLPANAWHLVVVQAAAAAAGTASHGAGTIPVGFVVMASATLAQAEAQAQAEEPCLVRRYDASTEEVSWEPVDSQTVSNLRAQLHQLGPPRVIDYQDLVPETFQWQQATRFINAPLLQARNLRHGDKIVPGSYTCTTSTSTSTCSEEHVQTNRDGFCIAYPPIPVLLAVNKTRRHYSQHGGTKQFLTTLTPNERTALLISPTPLVLPLVLHKYYQNDWNQLLGDLQLAHLVFLQLHCLASFEHWRDLVAMLCQEPLETLLCNIPLYTQLFSILALQIVAVDSDFFDNDNDTTDDNFLLPCLQRLCQATASLFDAPLVAARTQFCRILENRFPLVNLHGRVPKDPFTAAMEDDEDANQMDNAEDEDEEDSPVMVSLEEYEASLTRSSVPRTRREDTQVVGVPIPPHIQQQYPILFAAQRDHEDVLMTCARALHDKNDVSLVREAADFLMQQVEPSATCTSINDEKEDTS